MSALLWLLTLTCLLVVLFLLAAIKPIYQNKKILKPTISFSPKNDTPTTSKTLQGLSEKLASHLPEFRLIAKTGTTERLLIKQKDHHYATLVLQDFSSSSLQHRVMADVLIIEMSRQYDDALLQEVATYVRTHKDKTAQT